MAKNCLAIFANPNPGSFTGHALLKYLSGIEDAQRYYHETINVFNPNQLTWQEDIDYVKDRIREADLLVFAFPLWWEMPPYPLVEFLQKIFVSGFAYEHVNGIKVPIIDVNAVNLISMGRRVPYNHVNLDEAMRYCGINPTNHVFQGVGPELCPAEFSQYLERAYELGFTQQ